MVEVSVIIGSESDDKLGESAAGILKEFGTKYELKVFSAHRDQIGLADYIDSCDASVFIAIAGLSAALPGFIAAHTLKPVIGVPREVKLGGLDSLLSIVQMPSDVPVACVGIDAAKNAAFLALEILALENKDLRKKLEDYRRGWSSKTSSPRN